MRKRKFLCARNTVKMATRLHSTGLSDCDVAHGSPQPQEAVALPLNTAESPYAPLQATAASTVQQQARSQYAPSATVALPRSVTPSMAPEPIASISLIGGRVTPLYAPASVAQRNVTPSISTEPVAAMPLLGGRVTPLYAPAPAFAEMHAPPATFRPLSPPLQYAPPTASVSGPNQPFLSDNQSTLTLQMPEEQPVLVAPVSFEMNVTDPDSSGAPSQTVVKKTVRKVKKTAGTTGKKTAVPLQASGSGIV